MFLSNRLTLAAILGGVAAENAQVNPPADQFVNQL
jgi:hypothetical protein